MTGTIRLRFVAEAGFASALILLRTGGLYTHVGAITEDGRELGARFFADKSESGRGGVQLRPADYAEFKRVSRVDIPCSAIEHVRFWKALRLVKGDRYSAIEILGDALGKDFPVRGRFVCSALIHWALTEAGMTDFNERGRSRLITPDWLYGYASGLRNGRLWGMRQ